MTGAEILAAVEENRKHEKQMELIGQELYQQQAYLRRLEQPHLRRLEQETLWHAVGS